MSNCSTDQGTHFLLTGTRMWWFRISSEKFTHFYTFQKLFYSLLKLTDDQWHVSISDVDQWAGRVRTVLVMQTESLTMSSGHWLSALLRPHCVLDSAWPLFSHLAAHCLVRRVVSSCRPTELVYAGQWWCGHECDQISVLQCCSETRVCSGVVMTWALVSALLGAVGGHGSAACRHWRPVSGWPGWPSSAQSPAAASSHTTTTIISPPTTSKHGRWVLITFIF